MKKSPMKYVEAPNEFREQLIGADKRSIDRTLLRNDGTPRCISLRIRNGLPYIRFAFNTRGWPKKHQSYYEVERRVYNVDHCRQVYRELVWLMVPELALPPVVATVLMAAWQDFITAYDHYLD